MKTFVLVDQDGEVVAGPVVVGGRAAARDAFRAELQRQRLPNGTEVVERDRPTGLPEYERPYTIVYAPQYHHTSASIDALFEQDREAARAALYEASWYLVRDANGRCVTGRPTLEEAEAV
jgi:hypothetical protein